MLNKVIAGLLVVASTAVYGIGLDDLGVAKDVESVKSSAKEATDVNKIKKDMQEKATKQAKEEIAKKNPLNKLGL
jgi:hypothetical protein